MCLPVLRRVGFQLQFSFDLRDPRVRRVLRLMLPVTIGLGLINFNLLINSSLGSLVSDGGAARDRRRVPHLHAARRGCSASRWRPCCSRRSSRLAARHDLDGLRRASGNGVRHDRAAADPGRGRRPRCSPSRSPGSSTSAGSSAPASTDAGDRGAVLVLLLPAVRGREPAAHAHVLLAPAPVGRRPRWRGVTLLINVGRVGRALQAARDRRRRDRHRGRERRDDRSGRPTACAGAARLRDRPRRCAASR